MPTHERACGSTSPVLGTIIVTVSSAVMHSLAAVPVWALSPLGQSAATMRALRLPVRLVCQTNPRCVGLAYLVVDKAGTEYRVDDDVGVVEQPCQLRVRRGDSKLEATGRCRLERGRAGRLCHELFGGALTHERHIAACRGKHASGHPSITAIVARARKDDNRGIGYSMLLNWRKREWFPRAS